jgi:CMP-N,N'-diacetyllegionaminic acid synthase
MYKGYSILAIIPARGGSKGVPRKNIRLLAGKPLIAWTIETAKKSKYIDRIIVSTEDEEIMDIALNFGAEVPFLRPAELAKDDTPGIDPILYTVKKISADEKNEFDFILILQPTSPLRTERHIDEAVESLLDNLDKFDSLISVTELEHPVYWNRIVGSNKELKNFINYDKNTKYRRQDFEKVYRLNGALYLFNTNVLIKSGGCETDKTMAYIMDRKSSIDIDSLDDFDLAEYYIRGLHYILKSNY